MKVFISWSGARSRMVAEALHGWLPNVLQALEPWLSSADIQAGARWHHELAAQLATTSFGILCVTPENLRSSWLLYEAGALSKSVDNSRVVPYLVSLDKSELDGPLGHFQAVEAVQKEETFGLLRSLNQALAASQERALGEAALRRTYELWWPQLESALQTAEDGSDEQDAVSLGVTEARLLRTLARVATNYSALLERVQAKDAAATPGQEGEAP